MIDTKDKTREQFAKEVFEKSAKNGEFFKFQSRDTLQIIIEAMKGEAIVEKDEKEKNKFLDMAKLA